MSPRTKTFGSITRWVKHPACAKGGVPRCPKCSSREAHDRQLKDIPTLGIRWGRTGTSKEIQGLGGLAVRAPEFRK